MELLYLSPPFIFFFCGFILPTICWLGIQLRARALERDEHGHYEEDAALSDILVTETKLPVLALLSCWAVFGVFVCTRGSPTLVRGVPLKEYCITGLEALIYFCLVWLFSSFVDGCLGYLKCRTNVLKSGISSTFDLLADRSGLILKILGTSSCFVIYLGLVSFFFSQEAATFRKFLASLFLGLGGIAAVLRMIAVDYLNLVYIIWEGNFSLGDEIQVYDRMQGTVCGVVRAVDSSFTEIVGSDGVSCLVPNKLVVNSILLKLRPGGLRKVETNLEIQYGNGLDQAKLVLFIKELEAAFAGALVPAVGSAIVPPPMVSFAECPLQPSGISIKVGVFEACHHQI